MSAAASSPGMSLTCTASLLSRLASPATQFIATVDGDASDYCQQHAQFHNVTKFAQLLSAGIGTKCIHGTVLNSFSSAPACMMP